MNDPELQEETHITRRLVWSVADQAVSSLTNFSLGILVARSTSPSTFGAFSLAFLAYVFVGGVSRALNSEPLLVRFSGDDSGAWKVGVQAATGASLVVGFVCSAGFLLVGALTHQSAGRAFTAFAPFLPLLLLQDTWRFAFFARGKPQLALVNDGVWAIVLFSALVVLKVHTLSVTALIVAWGLSGSIAGGVGILQARLNPRIRATRDWWCEQRDLGARFVVESLAQNGTNQFVTFLTGVLVSLEAIGVLRAGQIVFGPLRIVFFGLRSIAIPEGVRAAKRSVRTLLVFSAWISIALLIVACTWGLALMVIPLSLGHLFMGEVWSPARTVFLAVAVDYAALGVAIGAWVGLRALGAANRSLWTRLLVSPLLITGGLVGAFTRGAVGAAWGFAIASVAEAAIWWISLWKETRKLAREEEGRT